MPRSSYVTVTDIFCGAGGSSVGVTAAGAELRLGLNHWDLAIESHSANFPNAGHDLIDVRSCDPRRYPSTDMLIASPECFPAGTLILCRRGLIPIERVTVGDQVLTHKNRWRPVTKAMAHTADTILIKGHGHPGIEATPEHPFLARGSALRNRRHRVLGTPAWVPGRNLGPGQLWASPTLEGLEGDPAPSVGGRGSVFSADFWWMVGKWLADGLVTEKADGARHIRISCSLAEAEDTYTRINFSPPQNFHAGRGEYHWSKERRDRQVLLTTSHQGLGEWLTEHFGKGAHAKMVPAWALTMPREWREALLAGYLYGDGTEQTARRERTFATVSKSLAIGIRLIILSLGYGCSLTTSYNGTPGAIDGRAFTRRVLYIGSFIYAPTINTSVVEGAIRWSRVRSTSPGRQQVEVFNLSVEEDESYTADGLLVHNCTSHTLAKGRKRKHMYQQDLWGEEPFDPGEERSRATMWDVPRFAEYHTYRIVIVENVVDACLYWAPFPAWLHAMGLLGYEHQLVFFNSMFALPTPQSRDRLYVVFWRRGNRKPDLAITPTAWCPVCTADVAAEQAWKNPAAPRGKYGPRNQYLYCCPTCQSVVEPYYYCSANVIDWSLRGERIGDRRRPLQPKTMARIQAGLDRYSRREFVMGMERSGTPGRAYPIDGAYPTQTAWQDKALVCPPPFVVSTNYWKTNHSALEPMPTMITETQHGVVLPPTRAGLLLGQQSGATARSFSEATPTISTAGAVSVIQTPAPFILDARAQAALLVGYHRTGQARPLTEPTGTQSTHDREALLERAPEVADCTFRMLQPHEIKAAMAFPADYIIKGTGRDQVRQLGNAVTPPAIGILAGRCLATLAG